MKKPQAKRAFLAFFSNRGADFWLRGTLSSSRKDCGNVTNVLIDTIETCPALRPLHVAFGRSKSP